MFWLSFRILTDRKVLAGNLPEIIQDICRRFIMCLQLAAVVKNATVQILPHICPLYLTPLGGPKKTVWIEIKWDISFSGLCLVIETTIKSKKFWEEVIANFILIP
jgi:hypothetical protein